MGFSKEQLLQKLQELKIEFTKYEHPVVLTVEAQAKHIGDLGGGPGGISKNLFLKDKKNRFYIVSALADTKVDLKAEQCYLSGLVWEKVVSEWHPKRL
ncbi:prolyl-tRNA synthetase associated domain-containing protein 1-like [Trifolium pratense]|uniref:Prolyl-tRNA synthetase associated domain-containing protein 1-like n=1 Tax=Trifolium pratense TaxID=57577 RepID=A0A2K3M2D3_TRIPR|nr:prolyl-tRNA synthetase associated domain-containing protein 1-like [Trifolium pratense]